jgi:glyoxylase-like metal-dependent hydrolase (beta-lactamase superfamily II)
MLDIEVFEFSPFSENTYVVSHSATGECAIIDPGCYEKYEQNELLTYINTKGLKPVKLLNTHCHIDHVFGNAWVHRTYGLLPVCHLADVVTLHRMPAAAQIWGITGYELSPEPVEFIDEGDTIALGHEKLDVIFVPGHAPGHVAFISRSQKFIIGGDVLFNGSIGRVDLPGGDYVTLMESIKNKFLPLGDDFVVHSGHGPSTTIGREKKYNPFILDYMRGNSN